MIISNFVENSDGTSDFDFKVDAKESEFLMSFAIKALMREGIIKSALDEEYNQEIDLPLETKH
jgi:hypothetical protein|tara:strand:+ start:1397 stop:1585 length:189 start_codon:yes stop_codon:yes gene_type:complete